MNQIKSIFSLTITIGKLFRINVQHTVIKGYHYFKIKPPKALYVEVDTMFTHMYTVVLLIFALV